MNEIKKSSDAKTLQSIIDDHFLTQAYISTKYNVSRQLISLICKGERTISSSLRLKLSADYPEYFSSNIKPSEACNFVEIMYCPEIKIPYVTTLKHNSSDFILLDRKFIKRTNNIRINPSTCKAVTLAGNSLSPYYEDGDKVIVDTSINYFIEDQLFVFLYKDNCYIRKIHILPEKIKCISIHEDGDTFEIKKADIYNILGMVLPRFRF